MTLSVRNRRLAYVFRVKRRLRHVLKKVYQRFLASNSRPRPVFILGSGRSGTDIVAHCLGKAWDTELINEDNPKAFENWRLKSLDTVGQAVETSCAELVLFKPIVETLRAKEFLQRFPDGAVIFVIRHPYDAINSMVRFFGSSQVKAVKSWVGNDFKYQQQAPSDLKQFICTQCNDELSPEDAAALYWLLYNSAYHFVGLYSVHNAMLVSYEGLVQTPDKSMKEVCRFLGLKWQSSMTDEVYSASLGKHPKPNLAPEIEKACLNQWERLTGEQL